MAKTDPSPAAQAISEQGDDERQKAEFFAALSLFKTNCGSKPSTYDIWLMARGVMDTNGRSVLAPALPTSPALGPCA